MPAIARKRPDTRVFPTRDANQVQFEHQITQLGQGDDIIDEGHSYSANMCKEQAHCLFFYPHISHMEHQCDTVKES